MTVTCAQPKCTLQAATDSYLCDIHDRMYDQTLAGVASPERTTARMDPTTDRDRWDVWDGGGLERPGEDG